MLRCIGLSVLKIRWKIRKCHLHEAIINIFLTYVVFVTQELGLIFLKKKNYVMN